MKDECKLSEQQVDQLATYDRSINHHCRACVDLELQRHSALEMVQTLEQGKMQLISKVLADAGVDPKTVASVHIDGDTVRYTLKTEG